jgi:hypothetical protein
MTWGWIRREREGCSTSLRVTARSSRLAQGFHHLRPARRLRDGALKATDRDHAPWHIVRSDDKRRGRLNCISQILKLIPHEEVARPLVKLPKRSRKHEYDDQATLRERNFVPELF